MISISYDQFGMVIAAAMGSAIGLWKVLKIVLLYLRKLSTKKDGFLSIWPEEVLKQPVTQDTTYLSLNTHKEMCMRNLEPIRADIQWIKDELVESRQGYRDLQLWYNALGDRLTKTTESIRESMDNSTARLEAKIDRIIAR